MLEKCSKALSEQSKTGSDEGDPLEGGISLIACQTSADPSKCVKDDPSCTTWPSLAGLPACAQIVCLADQR